MTEHRRSFILGNNFGTEVIGGRGVVSPKAVAAGGVTKQDNIFHWFKCEDTSDSVGELTLNATGTPSSVTGTDGNAYNYGSTETYHTTSANIDPPSPYSISLWWKKTDYDRPALALPDDLFDGGGDGFPRLRFGNGDDDAGNLEASYYSADIAKRAVEVTPQVSIDTWYNIIFVLASGAQAIYFNGSQVLSRTDAAIYADASPARWGYENANNNCRSECTVDDVRFYNVALDQTDATAIYGGGAGDYP